MAHTARQARLEPLQLVLWKSADQSAARFAYRDATAVQWMERSRTTHQAVSMRPEGTLSSAAVNLARTVIDRSAFYSPQVLPRITLT